MSIPTDRGGRLALSLPLLIVLAGLPVRGQSPATSSGSPQPVPNDSRPQETKGMTSGTPAPVAVQADPAPVPLPYPESVLPVAPVESLPPPRTQTEGVPWGLSPGFDAFSS